MRCAAAPTNTDGDTRDALNDDDRAPRHALAATTDEQDREYRRCRHRDEPDEERAAARERSWPASRASRCRGRAPRPLHRILDRR